MPPPPPALAHRLEAALDWCVASGVVAGAGPPTPEDYLAAAETLAARLLQAECTSRDTALDLLVVDALVTYAFELAGDEPAAIDARAERAMRRLAALAGVSDGPGNR